MKVLKLLAAMLAVAVVAALLFNYPTSAETSVNKQVTFCTKCHEMKPSYYTWAVTSHSSFGCLKCHTDYKITTFAYKHWLGAVNSPIESKGIIANETCKSCHTKQRAVTPPGDIIFPHELHVIKHIDCVDCHSAVSHLNVSEYMKNNKSVTAANFGELEAQRLIVKENQIPMKACLRCHNGDMAPNYCSTCHKEQQGNDKPAN